MNDSQELTTEDYERAEKFLPWNVHKLVFNTFIQPNWINKSDKFWYLNKAKDKKEFIIVDPEKAEKKFAFDHEKITKGLSEITKKSYKPDNLPFDEIEFLEDQKTLLFAIRKKEFVFDLESYECKEKRKKKEKPIDQLISPNDKWATFIKDHNIFVRSLTTNEEIQLTRDGELHNDYGTLPESSTFEITIRRLGLKLPPIALWSPDSKKLAVYKIDQRNVKFMHLIQSASLGKGSRPILHSYRYPLPEDEELAQGDLIILDIEKKNKVITKYKPQQIAYIPPIYFKMVWWSENSEKLYFIYYERGFKTGRLCEVNATTGETRVMIEEQVLTHIDVNHLLGEPPNIKVLNNGDEIIWFSQRDGWGHLYLYDGKSGELKNQITSGSWLVRDIVHIDNKNRWVYFLAGGKEKDRDPYYKHLYRAKFDGNTIELLTPENADHEITFSPTGKYYVDNFARVDTAPASIVRDLEGNAILNLESSDLSLLFKKEWTPPEQFRAKARDGETDIYGVIFFPTTFNQEKKYPVIDAIYPGPQVIRTPKQFPLKIDRKLLNYWDPQSLAELGFIVITVDGMGTPLRSKRFHDYAYGNMEDGGGLKDHIAAIKQLAEKYSFMDIDRVGIYGHSGGGFASARAILLFPDFYKVAVSSAGNHDQRGYLAEWGEKYQGMLKGDNYNKQINYKLAKNLKGKLLLAYGDLDDNVHPALTLQLVDALIKQNKDFDLLVLPNRSHLFSLDAYFIRKRWDYFVEHLLGLIPPREYEITPAKMEFIMNIFQI